MNWINLEVKTLRSDEYISSSPTERATWLNLLAWCCEQENGGIIEDCRDWSDRKWNQLCGVFKSEVEAGKHLFSFSENNLRIMFYPLDKEQEVQTKRIVGKAGGSSTSFAKAEAARENGSKGGRPSKKTQAETQAEKPNNPSETQAETQGKGKEGKGIGKEYTPLSPPEGAVMASEGKRSDYGKFSGFTRFWESYPARNGVRQGKAEAAKVWQRAKLEQQADKIVAHVEEMAKTADWRKEQGRFIPQARTYLNQRRWDDEIDSVVAQRTPSASQQRNVIKPDYWSDKL